MYFTTAVAVAVVVAVHDSWDGLRQTGKEYLFEGLVLIVYGFISYLVATVCIM